MGSRARRLPTCVPVPVDDDFIAKFVEGGWARVQRIYGLKRAQVWVNVIGLAKLQQMRREYLAGRKG